MSPALNGSSAIQHFEGSNANEISDGITFKFNTGLTCAMCGDVQVARHQVNN